MKTPEEPPESIKEPLEFISKVADSRTIAKQFVKVVQRPKLDSQFATYRYKPPLKAIDLQEGQEIPPPEFEAIRIKSYTVGLRLPITRDMIKAKMWDTIEMYLEDAGHALARKRDVALLNELVKVGASISAKTAGVLSPEDINSAKGAVKGAGFVPDRLVLHPDAATPEIMHYDMEEIRIYGLKALIIAELSPKIVLVLDSNHAGILFQAPINIPNYRDSVEDLANATVIQRIAPTAYYEEAIAKIIIS